MLGTLTGWQLPLYGYTCEGLHGKFAKEQMTLTKGDL